MDVFVVAVAWRNVVGEALVDVMGIMMITDIIIAKVEEDLAYKIWYVYGVVGKSSVRMIFVILLLDIRRPYGEGILSERKTYQCNWYIDPTGNVFTSLILQN